MSICVSASWPTRWPSSVMSSSPSAIASCSASSGALWRVRAGQPGRIHVARIGQLRRACAPWAQLSTSSAQAGKAGALARLVVGLTVREFQQARAAAAVFWSRQAAARRSAREEYAAGMVRRVAGAKLLGKVHLHAKTPRQIGVAVQSR